MTNCLQSRGDERMERTQTTIRLPAELKEQIQRKADREGQSFNMEIMILLRKGLGLE